MDWKKALIGRFPIDKGGPVGEIPLLVTNIALISTGLSIQYRNEHLALRCHDSSMYNIPSCHPIRYLSLRSQAFVRINKTQNNTPGYWRSNISNMV